ncbi:hypothetical protein LP419_39275 [Massilia sp. H-1]|nr:hypothetical protein LP419_39275 [Massilia sp. H-1]
MAATPPLRGVEYQFDGGAWSEAQAGTPGSYGATIATLADGPHQLAMRAIDGGGHPTAPVTVAFTVDNTAPVIAVTGVAEGAMLRGPVTPVVVITEPNLKTSSLTLNGQPYVSGTPVAAEGSYTLAVTAQDQAGNSASLVRHFTLDRTAPAVTAVTPFLLQLIGTLPQVQARASDAAHAGVALVEYSLDNAAFKPMAAHATIA